MFNKDGSYKNGKWRFHCQTEDCKKYIMMQWGGGGYGSATDKDGIVIDVRNTAWNCDKHN